MKRNLRTECEVMARSNKQSEPPNRPEPWPVPVYLIRGAKKNTGEEVSVVVCAYTKKEAEQTGYNLGLYLSTVEPTSDNVCSDINLDKMRKLIQDRGSCGYSSRIYLIRGNLYNTNYEFALQLPTKGNTDKLLAEVLRDTALKSFRVSELPFIYSDDLLQESQSLYNAIRHYVKQKKVYDAKRKKVEVRALNAPVTEAFTAQRNVIRSIFKSTNAQRATENEILHEIKHLKNNRGKWDYDEFTISWELPKIINIMQNGRNFMALSAIELSINKELHHIKSRKRVINPANAWEPIPAIAFVFDKIKRYDELAQAIILTENCNSAGAVQYLSLGQCIDLLKMVLKSQNVRAIKILLEELRKKEPEHSLIMSAEQRISYLNKTNNNDSVQQLSGQEFELKLAGLFSKLGLVVEETPSSHDFGADLIVTFPDQTKVVIQAKRYQGKVNLKAVQEVVSAREHYEADFGIVISTGFFLKSAIKLAASNDIELWGMPELNSLINKDLSFSHLIHCFG